MVLSALAALVIVCAEDGGDRKVTVTSDLSRSSYGQLVIDSPDGRSQVFDVEIQSAVSGLAGFVRADLAESGGYLLIGSEPRSPGWTGFMVDNDSDKYPVICERF